MLEPAQRAEVGDIGLARWPAPIGREVGNRVIEFNPAARPRRVGKAARRLPQEYRLADPSWNLIAIHRRGVRRVDDRLNRHLAPGLGEEAVHLAEGDRADVLQ